MGLFKERIMICLSTAFLAASALSYRLTFDGKLVLLALILLFCSFSILLRRGDVLALVLLFLSVSAAILLSYVTFDHPLSGCRPLIDGQNHRIEAKVIEMASKTSYSSSLRLHIQTVDGSPSNFRAVVETAFPFSAKEGQTVTADVSFSDFEDMADSFPERIYEHSRGYFLKAECEADMTLLSQDRHRTAALSKRIPIGRPFAVSRR